MKPNKIRPLALGVLVHEEHIFVAENYDRFADKAFYRPLGGRIEFGEVGAHAVAREFVEEIQQPLTDVVYLGLIENLFSYGGESGHELVLLYTARFVSEALYDLSVSVRGEDMGRLLFIATWQPIQRFQQGDVPLYPEGLLDMLAT